MDINIFAQTLFYIVSSIAILVVGSFLAIILYHFIKVAKNLEIFSNRLNNVSEEIVSKIKAILEKLANLPLISLLVDRILNKKTEAKPQHGETKKGRKQK